MKKSKFITIDEKDRIIKFLEGRSPTMAEYVKNTFIGEFVLVYKFLSHSDIPTFAKRTKNNGTADNLLYYATIDEMDKENREKVTETAHQSNIYLMSDLLKFLNVPDPRKLVKEKKNKRDFKKMNKFCDVYLVNDCTKYFNAEYTKSIFEKLHKDYRLKKDYKDIESIKLNLEQGAFTPITMSIAVHGLGVTEDEELRKLRHFMFKGDILAFLAEKRVANNDGTNSKPKLFILPIKNQIFFNILGIHNKAYSDYMELLLKQTQGVNSIKEKEEAERQFQNRRRNDLAEEMSAYNTEEDVVFCPISMIKGNFKQVGTIYRASHIKEYKNSTDSEKYDINNGLLLSANADALFDKHLITIDENKRLVYSFLIERDPYFKMQLRFETEVFKPILNEKRMKYLEIHRKRFYEEENNRKSNKNS